MFETYWECQELAVNTTGLEDVERRKTFRDAQAIVFLVVDDQLRRLPVIEVTTRIVFDPGI